jgi:hypothetical protein
MQFIVGNDLLQIKSQSKGFLIESKNNPESPSLIMKLIDEKIITGEGLLEIKQNTEFIDIEDRVLVGVSFINNILNMKIL